MYDQLLAPTDGSPEVEQALEYAVDLAREHDATIRGLYVVNAAGYVGLPMETAWDGVSDVLRGDGERALRRLEEIVPSDIPVETVVREGSPSRAIVEEAETSDCDLVVMGTHGRGGIDRLLLGSITECVVRRAPVPVLTIQVDRDGVEDRPEPTSRVTLE
ncbi:universal stress protein [Natrarchaeobaculum aegyptiacum]|uniref:Stress response protein n=1 Tax=Natrarchaeobaculum aegyptiacum TaxID=745377 RepID=A0A2Z2HTQ0_9EURY|nr:universal stress protein [Natrarchaeobaculum aegyptiacum]ARS90580.1 stress response protein [Natrarchaeobaculum aegyptiacum]